MTTMRWLLLGIPLIFLVSRPVSAAVVIASEDFDGGAVNLVSSTVPTLDGGPGDTFAVGAMSGWPTDGGTPFSLADNSAGDVGDSTSFPGDNEGVYGVNSNVSNRFLGISDTREWTAGEPTASWVFDISGGTGLELQIGMGSMEGSNFSYDAATNLVFQVSIDGGNAQVAFEVAPSAAGDGYSYRAMDDGMVYVANDNALAVGGDNLVEKLLAEDGSVAGNTFLDKTPGSGAGQGVLDTFRTAILGTGNQLTLTLTANIPFEAVAIDNIRVSAVPEPASCTLLGLGVGLISCIRRRR